MYCHELVGGSGPAGRFVVSGSKPVAVPAAQGRACQVPHPVFVHPAQWARRRHRRARRFQLPRGREVSQAAPVIGADLLGDHLPIRTNGAPCDSHPCPFHDLRPVSKQTGAGAPDAAERCAERMAPPGYVSFIALRHGLTMRCGLSPPTPCGHLCSGACAILGDFVTLPWWCRPAYVASAELLPHALRQPRTGPCGLHTFARYKLGMPQEHCASCICTLYFRDRMLLPSLSPSACAEPACTLPPQAMLLPPEPPTVPVCQPLWPTRMRRSTLQVIEHHVMMRSSKRM